MTTPRLRKRRKDNLLVVKIFMTVATLVMVLTCSIKLLPKKSQQQILHADINQDRDETASYPGYFLDLWPDDRHTETYRTFLPDCLPENNKETQCQVRLFSDDNDDGHQPLQRIALARPPGRLGDVFVDFVSHIVKLHQQEETSHQILLIPTTNVIGVEHNYSKIIRFATLPVLLEATDLAFSYVTQQHNPKFIFKDDLLHCVQQALRWQCHLNQRTLDTAMITITLDRMMGFPSLTTRQLEAFLGLASMESSKKKHNHRVNINDLSLIVMDVINTGKTLVDNSGLVLTSNINKMIRDMVDQELGDASKSGNWACHPMDIISMA